MWADGVEHVRRAIVQVPGEAFQVPDGQGRAERGQHRLVQHIRVARRGAAHGPAHGARRARREIARLHALGKAVRARPGVAQHDQLPRVSARAERVREMDQRALHPAAAELVEEEGDVGHGVETEERNISGT